MYKDNFKFNSDTHIIIMYMYIIIIIIVIIVVIIQIILHVGLIFNWINILQRHVNPLLTTFITSMSTMYMYMYMYIYHNLDTVIIIQTVLSFS